MQSRWQNESKDDEDDLEAFMPDSLEELAKMEAEGVVPRLNLPAKRSSSITFIATELGRILTSQTRELLDFFADGLDGEPIFYQTKHGAIRIPAPLINIIGATTPANLSSILPRDAHDHGMLSRIIFVYAGQSEKPVPLPPELTQQQLNLQEELLQRLRRIQSDGIGVLTLSDDAREEYIRLYSHSVPTIEFRLNAYSGRRAVHLMRLAGVICLLRGESPYVISGRDMGLAHLILLLTEQDMDGAYAAMSKAVEARAYLIIRELLESSDGEISDMPSIQATLMRSGMDDKEITTAMERLLRSGRVRMNVDRLVLETGLGGLKARNYLNRWLPATQTHSAKAP